MLIIAKIFSSCKKNDLMWLLFCLMLHYYIDDFARFFPQSMHFYNYISIFHHFFQSFFPFFRPWLLPLQQKLLFPINATFNILTCRCQSICILKHKILHIRKKSIYLNTYFSSFFSNIVNYFCTYVNGILWQFCYDAYKSE